MFAPRRLPLEPIDPRVTLARALPSLARRAALLALGTGMAVALAKPAQAEDWEIAIGAGVMSGSAYLGSDEVEVTPLPYLDIEWRDRVFLKVDKGLGAYVLNAEDDDGPGAPRAGGSVGGGGLIEEYQLGVSVRPTDSRSEDDDNQLRGLGDVDLSAEIGVFGGIELGPVSLEAEIYQDVGDGHGGLTGEVGLGVGTMLGDGLILEGGPFLAFGGSDFTESFYGVTPAQSAASGLPVYDAGSGVYATGVEGMATYLINDHWSVTGLAEYSRLVGDAADSPIVEEKGAFSLGAFAAYRF